jgi:hypothetical protein
MCCKFLVRVCSELLGEITFEKTGKKKEQEEEKVQVEPFSGVKMIFLRSVENLLDVIGLRQGQKRPPEENGEKMLFLSGV